MIREASRLPHQTSFSCDQLFLQYLQSTKMSNIQIESDLKEILNKLDSKLDKLSDDFDHKLDKLDNKIDKLSDDVTDINLRLTKVETKLDEGVMPRLDALSTEIKDIKGSQKAQIWTLIGILITAVGGFIVAVGKVVFFSP